MWIDFESLSAMADLKAYLRDAIGGGPDDRRRNPVQNARQQMQVLVCIQGVRLQILHISAFQHWQVTPSHLNLRQSHINSSTL